VKGNGPLIPAIRRAFSTMAAKSIIWSGATTGVDQFPKGQFGEHCGGPPGMSVLATPVTARNETARVRIIKNLRMVKVSFRFFDLLKPGYYRECSYRSVT
jgi:hypothetical protein